MRYRRNKEWPGAERGVAQKRQGQGTSGVKREAWRQRAAYSYSYFKHIPSCTRRQQKNHNKLLGLKRNDVNRIKGQLFEWVRIS